METDGDMEQDVKGREIAITSRLVSGLYVEAMLLADEARAYFDEGGRPERDLLPPLARVSYSCESLKVTTRLMHVIAWLLMRRAVEGGEVVPGSMGAPSCRLGDAPASDPAALVMLPERARALILASCDLYERVARLDDGLVPGAAPASPALQLFGRLESAF